MSILDKINDIKAKIEELETANAEHVETQEKMAEKISHNNAAIDTLKESISLVTAYIEEVELEELERKEYELEHFRTLAVVTEARHATVADIKTYAESVGIEYEFEPPAEQKTIEAVG